MTGENRDRPLCPPGDGSASSFPQNGGAWGQSGLSRFSHAVESVR
jgi:hypothetical protein